MRHPDMPPRSSPRMAPTRTVFSLISLAIFLCCANSENWPRFRGPNGGGIAKDRGVPVQWTERDGVRWKAALPGVGHSSPIVWGDRVLLQSATEKERLLVCLRVSDGKPLWTHTETG